ncbi:MAG: polysaccharide deacetylase family protein [Solirubrobacteraceae bacterium]
MSTHDHRTPGARIPIALGGAALLGYMLPGLAGAWPALRGPLGVEDHTASGRGYALTFDDGPHPQGTPAVLEILSRERVQATFFLVGEQVRRDPDLAREILAAGHAVGLHCDRHRNLLRLAPWQVRDDIDRALVLGQRLGGSRDASVDHRAGDRRRARGSGAIATRR